jgi:hypothetical protein
MHKRLSPTVGYSIKIFFFFVYLQQKILPRIFYNFFLWYIKKKDEAHENVDLAQHELRLAVSGTQYG